MATGGRLAARGLAAAAVREATAPAAAAAAAAETVRTVLRARPDGNDGGPGGSSGASRAGGQGGAGAPGTPGGTGGRAAGGAIENAGQATVRDVGSRPRSQASSPARSRPSVTATAT